jgi:hypothetical protein
MQASRSTESQAFLAMYLCGATQVFTVVHLASRIGTLNSLLAARRCWPLQPSRAEFENSANSSSTAKQRARSSN